MPARRPQWWDDDLLARNASLSTTVLERRGAKVYALAIPVGVEEQGLMRRYAHLTRFGLVLPVLLLSGCSGFLHFMGDTSGITLNRNGPIGDSENIERARGEDVNIKPLLTEPGDVWPGPPKMEPTLSDLQQDQAPLGDAGVSPGGRSRTPSSLPPALAVPETPAEPALPGTGPATVFHTPSGAMTGTPAPGGGFDVLKTPKGANGGIVIPNGNGTSTIIAPDGNVSTIPTPK